MLGQIALDGHSTSCKLLINFLRIALTRLATGPVPVTVVPPPTAPLADKLLLERFYQIRMLCFPQLNPNLNNIQNNQIVGRLGEVVIELRAT